MASIPPRHTRVSLSQLAEALRGMPFRPQQRRLIAEAFGRYGAEGVTREEFEAGLHRLITDRQYKYLVKPEHLEGVRRAVFPQARPFGRPLPGERPVGREAPLDRTRLRGVHR